MSMSKYENYDDVPFYRKQWFFWVMWFLPLLTFVAIVLLVSGDIFYRKKGQVRSFGMANRVVAAIIGLLWLGGLINALAGG